MLQLTQPEPRLTFVLASSLRCATDIVWVLRAGGVDAQLEAAAALYIREHGVAYAQGGRLFVPRLLSMYGGDFATFREDRAAAVDGALSRLSRSSPSSDAPPTAATASKPGPIPAPHHDEMSFLDRARAKIIPGRAASLAAAHLARYLAPRLPDEAQRARLTGDLERHKTIKTEDAPLDLGLSGTFRNAARDIIAGVDGG
jgi:hypothetical protein